MQNVGDEQEAILGSFVNRAYLLILISVPLCCVCTVSNFKERELRIKEKECKIHNY
jgi:hypothetical protein